MPRGEPQVGICNPLNVDRCASANNKARGTARILAAMLGPLDWYSAIEIGIAAAIVGIIVLISWWQRPPRG